MKIVFCLFAVLACMTSSAQFIGTRTNILDSAGERYVTNSPLNTPNHSRVIERIKDSTFHRLMSRAVVIDRLDSTHNDGVATNVVFVTNRGSLRRGTLPASSMPDTNTLLATRSWVTSQGYLKTESDPVWLADKPNYWTKTQSDARYLQTEVDGSTSNELQQLFLGLDDSLAITFGNRIKLPYLRSFTEVDGSVTNELQTLSLGLNDSLEISGTNKVKLPYLRTFTEVDGSTTNEIQTLALGADDSLAISGANKVKMPYLKTFTEVDGSTTNELQTLAIAGRVISISSGNSVTVPIPAYDSIPGKPTLPATFRDSVEYYGSAGRINQKIKVWSGIVTPTTGNGFNVDISAAGFGTILNVQAQAVNSTAIAASVPIVTVKSYTTTQVSLNIIQSNSQLLSILGVTVTGLIFATNLTGTTLHVQVTGY